MAEPMNTSKTVNAGQLILVNNESFMPLVVQRQPVQFMMIIKVTVESGSAAEFNTGLGEENPHTEVVVAGNSCVLVASRLHVRGNIAGRSFERTVVSYEVLDALPVAS